MFLPLYTPLPLRGGEVSVDGLDPDTANDDGDAFASIAHSTIYTLAILTALGGAG